MSTYDDDRLAALLRDAMQGEAETVQPAGDGLARIQQRVGARRARQRWLRPALALGSAAVLAALGLGAYALVNGPSGNDRVQPIVTPTETPSETPSPTPSATSAPVAVGFPARAIFPFTTAHAAKTWQQEYASGGHQPWIADPQGVATAWIANYVQQPGVDQVMETKLAPSGDRAAVTLGRTMTAEARKTVPVTVVRMVKYGDAWIVVGADDAGGQLTLSSPAPGATITSPVTVSGPAFGVDEAVLVEVRGADTPTQYGNGHASFGGGTGTWSTSVRFSTPSQAVGIVAVVEHSMADGGPSRIVVEQVHFTAVSGSAAPQYFYGVKNGRVTKFASRNAAAIDYLTDPQPGGGASDPQLFGTDVYYLQGAGTCANALMVVSSLPADSTQPSRQVATPDDGYVITGFSKGDGGLVYYEQACDSSRSPQAKLVTVNGHTRHVVSFPSLPPTIVADPSFEPPASTQYVDAVVRTGNSAYLARYDAMHGSSPTPSRNACPGFDVNNGMPMALETDRDGVVWFATQTGSSMQVVKCMAGGNTAIVAFTVSGDRTPADVDVSSDGSAVLLTDTDGHVWRWDGSGDATQLSPSVPLTQVTW